MASASVAERVADGDYDIEIAADVLIIGGSLSGLWAAIAAAQAGASVVIAEKGYAGTSGTIAAGSVGSYYIRPDDPVQRDVMVNARMPLAFGLADSRWGERILDQAYKNMLDMANWGYQWPVNSKGQRKAGGITPNVLLFLRSHVDALGVRVLDHSPVLELLTHDGQVAGASGVRRKSGETWSVRAGAEGLATGGISFLSGAAGTGGLTGDGYLLGSEVGAEFSGMEFTGQFHVLPHGGTLTKGAYRGGDWSTLYDNNGKEVTLGRQLATAILETGAGWDKFEESDPELQKLILDAHYVSTQFFDDAGIDPFKEKYRVDFICEGSIRATGGLAIDDDLQTNVPGLFASGDVTSREKTNGAGPPGGGPASAWAQGAGFLAGEAAARYAKRLGNSIASRKLEKNGGAGLRPQKTQRAEIQNKQVIGKVQEHMLAIDKNYWREETSLQESLDTYAVLWKELREGLQGAEEDDARSSARSTLKARETAGLLHAARLMNSSALERKETRGLHRRTDYPKLDPNQTHHLIASGLDDIRIKTRPVDPNAVVKQGATAI